MSKINKPPKAYRNLEFLNSPAARTIRILAEYNEPMARFKKHGIENLIVFFGSSRSVDLKTARRAIREKNGSTSNKEPKLSLREQKLIRLAQFYEDAVELSKKLTLWALDSTKGSQSHYVCSGGGPGMMEAANKGAKIAGGRSIGLNISIPTEQFPNPYISKELMFEFHYFFIRKFWFVYLAKALVIFPGGFGTMDELMEVLTLIQTHKITKQLPIIIYGTEYWNDIIDFKAMVEWGTIRQEDLQLIHFCDDLNEAYNYLIRNLKKFK
jgi:uncharacterized protein (TIGR00730 family)